MKNKYFKLFKKNFKNKVNIEEISMKNCSEWDSIKHFDLIASIENEVGIVFKPNDIMKFKSYKDGLNIIKKNL